MGTSSLKSLRIPASTRPGANLRSSCKVEKRPTAYRGFGRAAFAALSMTSATASGASPAATTSRYRLLRAARVAPYGCAHEALLADRERMLEEALLLANQLDQVHHVLRVEALGFAPSGQRIGCGPQQVVTAQVSVVCRSLESE